MKNAMCVQTWCKSRLCERRIALAAVWPAFGDFSRLQSEVNKMVVLAIESDPVA